MMLRLILWTASVVLVILAPSVSCDIFSSTSHLQNLMYLERHLVHSLYAYVDELEGKISQVRR